jgi:ParB family chromosome partitioning protein
MNNLGKGLSALISQDSLADLRQAYIPDLDIDLVFPNPYQPRIEIRPESLMQLSDSIRENGVLEPLIVTKKSDVRYELIAGERRWRAAKLAKLTTIPVVVKEASPRQMLELAIIENIHRKDLNPLEEALAFEQLSNLFNMTHDDIAKKIGFSRSVVANKMRLLLLPDDIKKYVLEERLSEGHARALLGLSSPDAMVAAAKIAVRDNLSVRAVEELVRRLNQGQKKQYHGKVRIFDEFTMSLEKQLQNKLSAEVKLVRTTKGGRIIIPFSDDAQLEKIYKVIL